MTETSDKLLYKVLDPEKVKPHGVWLLIGPRGSGKSYLLRDLLTKIACHRKFDYGVSMTATMSTGQTLKTMFPERTVHVDGYNESAVDRFVRTAVMVSENVHNKGTDPRSGLLVMDDCIYEKGILNSENQRKIHLNGRHYYMTVFNTTQYGVMVPPVIRQNVDYVVALADNNQDSRKKLYDYFFGSMFENRKEFERAFKALTKNNGAMVMHKSDIMYYRADAQPPPPRRLKLFKKLFYDMHRVYDDALKRQAHAKQIEEQKTQRQIERGEVVALDTN